MAQNKGVTVISYLPKATLIYVDGRPLVHISNIPGEKTARVYEPQNTRHLIHKTWANDEMVNQLYQIWKSLNMNTSPLPLGIQELARWRKWPEEKPEANGVYLCAYSGRCFVAGFAEGSWSENYGPDELLAEVQYWRPIGPLPGGE